MGGNITGIRGDGPREPAQQIARIAALLGEIEVLSRDAAEVPSPLLSQTRASLEKARSVLENCGRFAGHAVPDEEEEEDDDDPQPEVDNDLLDRMYRILAAGRLPSER
jgi:hypothetical protein